MSRNYEDVVNENKILQDKINVIEKENEKLKKHIQLLQDSFGYEICEFFEKCNSITETTNNFFFDNVQDCYEALKEYYGCSDPIQDASDYKKCYQEIFGREEDSE